jgi:hypothetical protein
MIQEAVQRVGNRQSSGAAPNGRLCRPKGRERAVRVAYLAHAADKTDRRLTADFPSPFGCDERHVGAGPCKPPHELATIRALMMSVRHHPLFLESAGDAASI